MREGKRLDKLDRGVKKLVDGACLLCGWALLVVVFLMCFEVVARKVFHFSIQGADEIGGYTIAIISCFGFAAALCHRDHVRIDLFIARAGSRLRHWLDVLAYLVTAVVATVIAWRAYGVLAETVEFGSVSTSPLQTPMWIPQVLWFSGLLLFAVVGIFMVVRIACGKTGKSNLD